MGVFLFFGHEWATDILTSKYSVTEQFRDFLSKANPDEQDLIPMVDVEDGWLDGWSEEQLRDSPAEFSWLVEKHYGRKPMIYSNESFYNAYLAPYFTSVHLNPLTFGFAYWL